MLPAAPLPCPIAIQAPSWPGRHAGTATAETRAVSDASAVPDARAVPDASAEPDELVAIAAAVMTSPATEAAAIVAMTRRAVCGRVDRYVMVGRPRARDPLFAASFCRYDVNDRSEAAR